MSKKFGPRRKTASQQAIVEEQTMLPQKRSYEEAIALSGDSSRAAVSPIGDYNEAHRGIGKDSSRSVSEQSELSKNSGHSFSRSSVDNLESDSEESSVVSTSSEETSSSTSTINVRDKHHPGSNNDEDTVVTIVPSTKRHKPLMKAPSNAQIGGKLLRVKLQSFLPQLAAANVELDECKAKGTLEQRSLELVDEEVGESYIEMNLGLGVLEHTGLGHNEYEEGDDSSDEDFEENSSSRPCSENLGKAKKEKDIFGRLMGKDRRRTAVAIQEIPNE